jgi:(S)-ureidoglycine aminohydrolase
MKKIVLISLLFSCMIVIAGEPVLPSKVNGWNTAVVVKTATGNTRKIFSGSGAILSLHEMNGITLLQGKSLEYKTAAKSAERFFIIKSGSFKVSLNDKEYLLGQGSVVFLLPGDKVNFLNTAESESSFYEMISKSSDANVERGQKGGTSFAMDFQTTVFKSHGKGGVRQLFDRPTVMMNRFDIHITTLNPRYNSHDPHVHKNEEIILMMDGVGDMFIATGPQRITTGDACYVESNVLHNITNMGNTPATYFAIQWN